MTTITYPSRPGLLAETEQVARSLPTRLRGAFAAWRAYRRTLAEFDALSIRQREDIGIAGLDTRELAREASRPA